MNESRWGRTDERYSNSLGDFGINSSLMLNQEECTESKI